jgi:hypothetical protein
VTLAEVLADIPSRLDRAGIPYMVTGSIASTLHGVPRLTLDLDVVIDPTPEALRRFLDALPPDKFYVDHEAARQALRERGQFNMIEPATGWKVDLLIRKDRAFSREEFERRRQAEIAGVPIYVATAEDMIVVKLEWAGESGSDRQLADVAGILAVSGPHLDLVYVERWVAELGLSDAWSRVREGE